MRAAWPAVVLAALLTLPAPAASDAPAAASANLAPNGSFEAGEGFGIRAPGWMSQGEDAKAIRTDAFGAYHGTHAMLLIGGVTRALSSTLIPVNPESKYVFEARIKDDYTAPSRLLGVALIRVFDHTYGVQDVWVDRVSDGEWDVYRAEFTTPAYATQLDISFFAGQGRRLVDDVRLHDRTLFFEGFKGDVSDWSFEGWWAATRCARWQGWERCELRTDAHPDVRVSRQLGIATPPRVEFTFYFHPGYAPNVEEHVVFISSGGATRIEVVLTDGAGNDQLRLRAGDASVLLGQWSSYGNRPVITIDRELRQVSISVASGGTGSIPLPADWDATIAEIGIEANGNTQHYEVTYDNFVIRPAA